jgi:hypothetical protein
MMRLWSIIIPKEGFALIQSDILKLHQVRAASCRKYTSAASECCTATECCTVHKSPYLFISSGSIYSVLINIIRCSVDALAFKSATSHSLRVASLAISNEGVHYLLSLVKVSKM